MTTAMNIQPRRWWKKSRTMRFWRLPCVSWRSSVAFSPPRITGASPNGPSPSDRSTAVGREGMDRPGLQGAGPRGWRQGLQGDRPRLDGTDRFRHPERLHEFRRARRYAQAAPCDRLHALLVLPAPDTRHVARMVPYDQLPAQIGPLAARGARRIRIDPAARGGG